MDHPAAAQTDRRPDAPEGEALPRQFGRYTLLRRLAVGGMAELFLALQRSVAGFEKLIVIKRILHSMNHDEAFIKMLLHEARIAATLSHPNIVQVFDVGQAEGRYFVAMEHIHGEDIQAIVRAMKKKDLAEFPIEHALSVVIGVCAGLAYAHEKGDLDGKSLAIVHRDISPRNVLVSFTGDVKIVDFGIAKSGYTATEETLSPQIKGKAPYMSPEQACGQRLDHRSDIFSLGIVLFELTTGKRLFKGTSEFMTLTMICESQYPRPSAIKPGYPPRLERIVMRALAKNIEARYQSARQMQADLEAFALEERIQVSQVNLTAWMQSLFEDKLAQQKEALQDVKQLADVIAAQALAAEKTAPKLSALPSYMTSAPKAPRSSRPPKRASALPWLLVMTFAIAGVAYFYFYHRHLDGLRAALTAATRAQRAPEGSLDIATEPDGCAIWINGDLRPETTPARIERLPFGRELSVKLTKEGFEPHREAVVLRDGEPSKRIDATLKADPAPVVPAKGGPPKPPTHH